MVVREVPVDLGEEGAGVVGALDGPVVARQGALELRVHETAQPGVDAPAVVLAGVAQDLLVVGGEEEGPVLLDGPSEGEAELPLAEVRLPLQAVVAGRARQGRALAEEVQGAAQLVAARLGDDVDEAAAGTAELGVGPLGHHDHLLHGVEIEGEGRALAAALLAEEGVVEIRAVHGDVVVDPPLPGDAQLVAVRSLDDGGARRQQGQVEEVAAVVGQVPHRLLGQARGRPAPGDVHRGHRGLDDDRLHLGHHLQGQFHGLPGPHRHSGPPHFTPSRGLYGHVVGTEGQQGGGEGPQVGRGERALVVGAGLPDRDPGVGHGAAELVPDRAADHPGGGLGQGLPGAAEQDQQGQDEERVCAGSPGGHGSAA